MPEMATPSFIDQKLNRQREELRGAMSTYATALRVAIQTAEKVHVNHGGQKDRILNLNISLAQVRSAQRVLWMDGP